VTYQLLAGRLPYEAASLTELALMQQRQQPARLDEVASEVPVALALAVQRALALQPEQRYASAEEMRAALHDGARGIAPAALAGDDETAATALLASREPTAATRAVGGSPSRRLQPQPGPPPAYERKPVAPRAQPSPEVARRRSGAAVLVAWVLLAALVAAGLAYAIGNSGGGSSSVDVRRINGASTDELVDQMTRLVDDNTR